MSLRFFFNLAVLIYWFSFDSVANKHNSDILSFHQNKGQLIDQDGRPRNDILYYGTTPNFAFYLKPDGISYQLYKSVNSQNQIVLFPWEESNVEKKVFVQRLDLEWVNSVPGKVESSYPGSMKEHFYNMRRNVRDVTSFGEVMYREIYPGIDLRYYFSKGNLKYDYIVHPGGNYRKIQIRIKGVTGLSSRPDGSVSLNTPFGEIIEGAPEVYQDKKSRLPEPAFLSPLPVI